MNFSFVIGMSQLHNTLLGNYAELLLLLCGIFFFFFHFIPSASFQWKSIIGIVALICVGIIAMRVSGGPTLLKLVLFFAMTQDVKIDDVMTGFIWSLIIPFVCIALLSVFGVIGLRYTGEKNALEFGMQNPNTVPVIIFAIIVAFNLRNQEMLNRKILFIESVICIFMYYLSGARTAGIVLLLYIVALILSKNVNRINRILWWLQYLFLVFGLVSIAVAILFRNRTEIWIQFNNLLSGRPLAWDLYLTKYGIKFWGQRIDLNRGALDNAYLRLLIQYGILTFSVYMVLFVQLSRYSYKKDNIILLLSVIASELYCMAEFGPILINFCPVLMYEACLLINYSKRRVT